MVASSVERVEASRTRCEGRRWAAEFEFEALEDRDLAALPLESLFSR